ncbi:hypothetical protein Tsubulata_038595 [Turnera subulata]|uniref:RING-type E3 ubiquitin transferase n=1 Tax=Turnera subulata TaxID=218843 RepID=A0A9Q0GDZ7_9ROSI|nr:hypothetical protein Tsubulata_038595 [Turnera subulata]
MIGFFSSLHSLPFSSTTQTLFLCFAFLPPMATFTSSLAAPLPDAPMIPASAATDAAAASSSATLDDAYEDACSICLEPFTSQDPATVTCCRHEYHLQCILEWSQRSKECPICWQLLVLKDPASQELLVAVGTERRLRSRSNLTVSTNLPHFHEDYDVEQDSCSDDSDLDEHIMQHLAAAASRARYVRLRERQRASGLGPSQVLIYTSPSNEQQTHTAPGEGQGLTYESLADSLSSATPSVPPAVNRVASDAANSDDSFRQRVFLKQPPVDSPQGPGSSEMLSFSDSIKTKWFAASARYKESFSKGTRGIKEKLLARNTSVKELSKGVQREMSAGLAGVARMIERLDLTPKRNDAAGPDSSPTTGASNFSWKGKAVTENIIAQALARNNEQIAHNMNLDASKHVSGMVPGQAEVPHIQRGN